MRYTSLPRTATFGWSPATYATADAATTDDAFALPLLATGTASGALDATFSTDAKLELWSPFGDDGLAPKGTVGVNSRFNRVVWGGVDESRPRGVLAAGMENGELDVWDPVKILEGKSAEECLLNKMTNHTGPIRGLDFNPVKSNLLASGATKGEIFIWDLTNPVKPFAPPPSRSLDDITSVGWNRIVQSVLAASSSNGYTVVWDIREANGQKGREVATLSYAGAPQMGYPGQGMPQQYGAPWMGAPGGRAGGISSVVWHPENPTKLATASEDDGSPVIMLWDLRNARTPERVLTGHEKGILSLAWCSRDSDMLVSCGKDCRTICWNPNSGNIVAELAPGNNWAFQTEWCPRNPDLLATGSFDGRIAIHSLQSTREEPEADAGRANAPAAADGSDIFGDQGILALNNARAAVSLNQAPKWLKRPASAMFGFGGKVVTLSHRATPQVASAPGEPVPPPVMVPSVKVRQAVTEPKLVERALKLENAAEQKTLKEICADKVAAAESTGADTTSWKLLNALFQADSRDELVTLLGFSKEEVKSKVEQQIAVFKAGRPSGISRSVSEAGPSVALPPSSPRSDTESVAREPLVTFADTPVEGITSSSDNGEAAAAVMGDTASSEASVSAVSESTKVAAESEITEPSLFGDEPQAQQNNQASADFYNAIRNGRPAALPDHLFNRQGQVASSVGATVGSRASSVASENMRSNTFKIYPSDESKGERLITRALVLGDFESAVSLCLSADRFADALLLAVRGGPELLQRTQKAYFERQTSDLPYLRLYQSIVLDDLADVVQNADLGEWQEIFVVLCTFAKQEEFSSLVEQLGQRLEFQYSSSAGDASALEYRKNAILCYLAAGRLEKVVSIWAEEMGEEEEAKLASLDSADAKSKYSLHVEALQDFIEKVTIFQGAVNYVDVELSYPTESAEVAESGARTYKLAPLYDRYCEYAELLSAQGLVTSALRFIALTPTDYVGASAEAGQTRTRLSHATGKVVAAPVAAVERQPAPTAAPIQSTQGGYNAPYATQAQPPVQAPYAPTGAGQYDYSGGYAPQSQYQPPTMAQAPVQNYANQYENPYAPSQPQQSAYNPPQGSSNFMPVPPPPIESSRSGSAPPPPKSSRSAGGWNDAPVVAPSRKNAGSAAGHKAAIMSPFPNAAPSSPGQQYSQQYGAGQQGGNVPPPPRGGARTPGQSGPPRHGQQPPIPPMQQGGAPYGGRPGSVGPYGPRPGSVGPPQMGRPGMPPQGAPGPYAPQQGMRATPPPGQGGYASGPPTQGQYAPPPGMQQYQQGRAPPPGQGQQQPSYANGGARPPPAGFAPPPGQGRAQPSSPAPAHPKPEPPKAKYPAGDRSHIPDSSRPIFASLARQFGQLKQVAPPNQKKLIDDTERRLNVLFDGLNCETISGAVVTELLEIVRAMDSRNAQQALSLHLSLLTSGIKSDTLTTFMPAIKVLIQNIR